LPGDKVKCLRLTRINLETVDRASHEYTSTDEGRQNLAHSNLEFVRTAFGDGLPL
jgi:hypothetical protein